MMHNKKWAIEIDGNKYEVPVTAPDNAIRVRVHNLPPQIPNNLIIQRFSRYGEAVSLKEETWKDFFGEFPNGVRILRMRLSKQIASYVPIDGEQAYVVYRNQIRTCKHCVRPLHIGRTCAGTRMDHGANNNQQLTTAQVVKEGKPAANLAPTTLNLQASSSTRSLNAIDVTSEEESETEQPQEDDVLPESLQDLDMPVLGPPQEYEIPPLLR